MTEKVESTLPRTMKIQGYLRIHAHAYVIVHEQCLVRSSKS